MVPRREGGMNYTPLLLSYFSQYPWFLFHTWTIVCLEQVLPYGRLDETWQLPLVMELNTVLNLF